jgi:tRNA threonylcarbamoyl adenosine modification protein (Sua5/YciO/YrdC/YwlC family)
MTELIEIHPVNPQPRAVAQVVSMIRAGGLVAYPTDCSYALGCHIGDKRAMERIRQIRRTDKDHNFTLVCRDLSEIATYARVDNWAYRLLKAFTPGPYTFILRATSEVPKRLQNPRRRTIGIRIPDHPIPLALLEHLSEPIMSSTLLLPGDELPITDPFEMQERLKGRVEAVIDGGPGGIEPSTVVDLSSGEVMLLRQGKGDISALV